MGKADPKGKLFNTPLTFSRRCYWLKSKPKFMLIHYLDYGVE